MKKADYLLENLKNIQDIVKFADQKATAILIVCGLLLTIFTEIAKKSEITFEYASQTFWSISMFLSGFIFIILIVIILYICVVHVLRPKFAKHYNVNDYSTFYYKHIADKELSYFKKKISSLDNEKIIDDLTCQVYEISSLLKTKNRQCAKLMYILFSSLLVLLYFTLSSIMV